MIEERTWQLTFLLIFSRPQACTVPGLDLLWNCGIETPTATYPPWQKMTRTEPKRQLHFSEFSFPRGHACFTWHVKVGCLSERLTVTQEDWVRLYDFHYSSSHHVNWVRNYSAAKMPWQKETYWICLCALSLWNPRSAEIQTHWICKSLMSLHGGVN